MIIKDLTGDWPVYPRHPLVLATVNMKVFTGFESANQQTEHGWSEAWANSRIPGAGAHVTAAMNVLKLGADGSGDDAMVKYALEYWVGGNGDRQ